MKKILFFIFIILNSCSKKTEDETMFRDRISTLQEQITKTEKFPIYLYYQNSSLPVDSTNNREIVVKNLSLVFNNKTYDVRKIWKIDMDKKQENLESLTTKMKITFLK